MFPRRGIAMNIVLGIDASRSRSGRSAQTALFDPFFGGDMNEPKEAPFPYAYAKGRTAQAKCLFVL